METSLSMSRRIAVIPGDRIGIDVTAEAVKVLETVSKSRALPSALCFLPTAYRPLPTAQPPTPDFRLLTPSQGRTSTTGPLLAGRNATARNRPIMNPPTWPHQATPPPVAD